MLEPQSRAALTEQLRPPTGFALSRAVGTTFTLNLESALSIPLSFASHRVAASDGNLGVLDAIRRSADRIDLFAQAGQLSMGTRSDLVAFLEPMVHPVFVRRGLFHPKVWFLEFESSDERRYRFLASSRNLTHDRTWDAVVSLDGVPASPAAPLASITERNAPLVSMLRGLPALAVQPLHPARVGQIEELADRWSRVQWETPLQMRDVAFHVFGMPDRPRWDLHGKRALIISPFLSDDGLAKLRSQIRTETHLVSRPESIDRLRLESLDAKLTSYVLDEGAVDDPGAEVSPASRDDPLVGLHAKIIVVDRQDGAHVFLGSANATGAALDVNVEVMVELVGSLNEFGVQPTLDGLGSLIEQYESKGGAQEDPNEKAARRLESYLRKLAGVRLTARVSAAEPFSLAIWAEEQVAADPNITLRWELITRPDVGARHLPTGEADAVRLDGLELTDITPFIVLIASDPDGNEARSVVVAQLLDDVENRSDAIIARQLTDTAAFIRLLALILDLSGIGVAAGGGGGSGFFGGGGGDDGHSGLFESLARAVGAGGAGLDDAARIIEFLRGTPDGTELLPPGFAGLWESVWAAHEQLLAAASGKAQTRAST